MKKKYITPAMEIVKIETQQIIAASLGMGVGNKGVDVADGREFDFDDLSDFDY